MEFTVKGIDIDLVAWLALGIAAWSAYLAHRAWNATQAADRPVIEVKITPLGEPHWWNIEIEARNRADYGVDGVTLECINPEGALLQAPQYDSIFDPGRYEIRSKASVESSSRSLPFRLALAPRGTKEEVVGKPPEFDEDRKGAWLYLPTTEAQNVKLKLTLRTREHSARELTYAIKRRLSASLTD